jgi:hypothetical protein
MKNNIAEKIDSVLKFREHIRQPNISLEEERNKLRLKLLKTHKENKKEKFLFYCSLICELNNFERLYTEK